MTATFWLSVFEPKGESWAWQRLDPKTGETHAIATLPWPNPPWPPDARLSRDGTEAMVVVRGAKPDRLMRVDLAGQRELSLPEGEHDFLVTASYDPEGQPLVVYADRHRLERIDEDGASYLVLDGERFQIWPEVERNGQLRIVVATVMRCEQGTWRCLERRAIQQRQPNSLGGLESAALLEPQGAGFDLRDGAIQMNARGNEHDEWYKTWGGRWDEYLAWYHNERGSRAVRFRAYMETRWLARPIVVQADAGWTALEAWAKYEYTRGHLCGEIAGDHLLLTDNRETRLHDLRTGAVIWEPPKDTRAGIWPAPVSGSP